MDELDTRVKLFFSDCKRYPGELPSSIDSEFQNLRKEYYKVLEDTDEKVSNKNNVQGVVHESYLICFRSIWLTRCMNLSINTCGD